MVRHLGGEAVLHVDSLEPYMVCAVRRPLHAREARFSQLQPAAKAAFFERAAALLRGLRRVECFGRGVTDVVLLALARAAGPQGLTSVAVEVRRSQGPTLWVKCEDASWDIMDLLAHRTPRW